MSRRRYFHWHDNGALMWTWPLTLAVSAVGLLFIGAAVAVWQARGPGEADSGDQTFMLLGPLGVAALIVAVGGRITTVQQLRYQHMTLPAALAAGAAASPGSRRRASAHRSSGIAYVFMALIGPGFIAAGLINWDQQPRTGSLLILAFSGAGLAGCYLVGPAAKFVVTPQYFHIDTAFRSTRVPRHLLGTFSSRGVDVRLNLTSGNHHYFRVDSPLWDARGSQYRTNGRTQLRTVGRIVTMLQAVPAEPTTGGVVVRSRPASIALAIAATMVLLATIIVAITANG